MEKRNTRVMTETEYRSRIQMIRKDREMQEKLNQVAEEHVRKRSTRPRPNPPQPKPAVRYVQPQPPPERFAGTRAKSERIYGSAGYQWE